MRFLEDALSAAKTRLGRAAMTLCELKGHLQAAPTLPTRVLHDIAPVLTEDEARSPPGATLPCGRRARIRKYPCRQQRTFCNPPTTKRACDSHRKAPRRALPTAPLVVLRPQDVPGCVRAVKSERQIRASSLGSDSLPGSEELNQSQILRCEVGESRAGEVDNVRGERRRCQAD